MTKILVYPKTFFHGRFAIGSKNFLGYTENNGADPVDFKENDKEKVCHSSLEIGEFLDNLRNYHNVHSGSATCHNIKEGFTNEAYPMTPVIWLYCGMNSVGFHRFFEKVIDVITVCVRFRYVSLKTLPKSGGLKSSLKPVSLTPKVFSALFLHKKIKSHFTANVLCMGFCSQSAIQNCN